MMGSKQRNFAPLINVSLEDLVPGDHFYRHLDRTLDLSFVREFVHETYAGGGRPSVDPSFSSSCNSSCFSRASCDAQIAYHEWGAKALPQARVQACHQFLRAFLVTGGCEARSNALGEA